MVHFLAKGLLFDLDGTLIDSFVSVERNWGKWADTVGINKIDFSHFHGVQRPDIVAALLPHLSAEEIAAHAETVRVAEATDTEGVIALAGSLEFLSSLPTDSWAIVTACDRETAEARLRGHRVASP